MKFTPSPVFGYARHRGDGSARQGVIRDITEQEIEQIFGFGPNVDEGPNEVVHSWAVDVDELYTIHVWDYKGSHEFGQFSVCGHPWIFATIFGDRYQCDRPQPYGGWPPPFAYARIPTWQE